MSAAPVSPKLYALRHSLAHLLASAVARHFPGESVRFAGGPPVADGFYYDFELPRALAPEELAHLENRMRELIREGFHFNARRLAPDEARQIFSDQPYKLELIEGILRGQLDENGQASSSEPELWSYQHLDFLDLCRGPHVSGSEELKEAGFALSSLAGAYWKGDEKRPMLQRIYAHAFESEAELEAFRAKREELARRDHRKLGKDLDLFFFHPSAPGMPYWLPKGLVIHNELLGWWREVHQRESYQEIASPLVNSKSLWECSGHWEHYRDDMYVMDLGESEVYGLKPMNCPNAMIVFNQFVRSYRQLPLRLSDCDPLHRHERKGALHGLLRVNKFQQDDAHIFVEPNPDAIDAEFARIFQLVDEFYAPFGLKYRFRLSLRPVDAMGQDALWDQAEADLERILRKQVGEDFERAPGEGAFYGPKIDILIEDAMGREWQMGTLKLDYQLPRRFDCHFVDKDGERRVPAVIHRVIYGSLERFIGVLLEHVAGVLPFWLAPEQLYIIPMDARHEAAARAFKDQAQGLRIQILPTGASLKKRVRDWQLSKVPALIVLGDRELNEGIWKLQMRGQEQVLSGSKSDLIAQMIGWKKAKA